MKNSFFILVLGILFLSSCASLNGTWVGVPYDYYQKTINETPSIPPKPHETDSAGLIREDISRRVTRIAYMPGEFLNIKGSKVHWSYERRSHSDSPLMFRRSYIGRVKRRHASVRVVLNKIKSTERRTQKTTITPCEDRVMQFVYGETKAVLLEMEDGDTTMIFRKREQ